MQEMIEEKNNTLSPETIDQDLHTQANKYLTEANYLVFQALPKIIGQLIEHQVWKEKNYNNFGEYALKQSSCGLSISTNRSLWLLKCAMDVNNKHAREWGDVLNVVDNCVRGYAKDNKIPIKELNRRLDEVDDRQANLDETLTYLPSRSNSNDGQLIKLRKKDQESYNKVIQGEMTLKEALPPSPKKTIEPIESVKNKFNNLSQSDREAFLVWLEQQKEN